MMKETGRPELPIHSSPSCRMHVEIACPLCFYPHLKCPPPQILHSPIPILYPSPSFTSHARIFSYTTTTLAHLALTHALLLGLRCPAATTTSFKSQVLYQYHIGIARWRDTHTHTHTLTHLLTSIHTSCYTRALLRLTCQPPWRRAICRAKLRFTLQRISSACFNKRTAVGHTP